MKELLKKAIGRRLIFRSSLGLFSISDLRTTMILTLLDWYVTFI